MSQIAAIGDDIVAVLTAAFAGEPVQIRRTYVPERWLQGMQSGITVIDVVARTHRSERQTRAKWQWTVTYDIGIRCRLGEGVDADDVLAIAEQVVTRLQHTPQLPTTKAQLSELEMNPIASPDNLAEYGVFTAVVTAEYHDEL